MKARVNLGPSLRRARFERPIHFRDEVFQHREFGLGRALRGRSRRYQLESFEQGEDLDHRGVRDRRDGGADVGDADHQAFRLQQAQCFPHRNDADPKLPGQVVDDEPRARSKLAAQDGFAQRRVYELLLRQMPAAAGGGRAEFDGRTSHMVNRVFCLIASFARMQARAEARALSAPHDTGVPTRTAEQKR
jgi:hypothetical protein